MRNCRTPQAYSWRRFCRLEPKPEVKPLAIRSRAIVQFHGNRDDLQGLGLEVRAVSQNRAMARAMGVRSSRVDALTFGLGSLTEVDGLSITWPTVDSPRNS